MRSLFPDDSGLDIATTAATLIVEEGLEYGPAKKKALKQLGLPPRTPMPGNDQVHEQVMAYIQLYCADTQPQELAALRELALEWMDRLTRIQPEARIYASGAVWLGSATRLSDIRIQAFCNDSKSLAIGLINTGVDFETAPASAATRDAATHLYLHVHCTGLDEAVGIHLDVYDLDAERGARLPDAQGLVLRGDAKALCNRMGLSSAPTSGR